MIDREEVPCWYELSWREKPPCIVIRIHQDRAATWEKISPQAPLVEHLRKEFGFTSFQGSLKGNFGFDNAIRAVGKKGDFFEFLVSMPRVQMKLKTPCDRCEGSGKDEFLPGQKCFSCRGSGKEYVFRWKKAFAISASLSILLRQLEFVDGEISTSASFPQLLTVITRTEKGMHGGSLSGTYSRILARWLSSFKPYTGIQEMIEAMKTAYAYMYMRGGDDFDRFRASVDYENGWLNVDCPGDACGLNPAHGRVRAGEGYEFSCHNVDTPVPQLTLLAGLAALHERARKELFEGLEN
jgi:hypothetical protein